jgi:hypothetical protein
LASDLIGNNGYLASFRLTSGLFRSNQDGINAMAMNKKDRKLQVMTSCQFLI